MDSIPIMSRECTVNSCEHEWNRKQKMLRNEEKSVFVGKMILLLPQAYLPLFIMSIKRREVTQHTTMSAVYEANVAWNNIPFENIYEEVAY